MSSTVVDALPQIGLGTAVLIIFVTVVGFVLLRGLLRMLWGVAQLMLAGAAALWVWEHGPPAAIAGMVTTWPAWVLCAAAAILTLMIGQMLTRILREILREPLADPDSPPSATRWAWSLLLSLLATLVLCAGAAIGVHHFGLGAEIEAYLDPDRAKPGWLASWRESIQKALPASWLAADPDAAATRLRLVKIMAAIEDPDRPDAHSQAADSDSRRALQTWLAAHPDLRQKLAAGRYAEALHDPRLDALLADPDMREKLAKLGL